MNQDLEEILKSQALRKPSAELDHRVQSLFMAEANSTLVPASVSSHSRRRTAAMILVAGLALGVVGLILTRMQGPATEPRKGQSPSTSITALSHPTPNKLVATALHGAKSTSVAMPAKDGLIRPICLEYRESRPRAGNIILLSNKTAVRPYRIFSVSCMYWQDPVRNVRVEARVPREAVVYMPVQTY